MNPLLLHCHFTQVSSVQFSSVAQSCLTLCDPMNRSTPGLPVHHQLPEFTQTHVIESMMPSGNLILCCPLLHLPPIPPSIRVFSNESTLRMRWPSIGVSASASVLPMNTQDWSLGWTGWISLQSRVLSRVFSNTTVQKHQFFGAQLSSQPYLPIYQLLGDAINWACPNGAWISGGLQTVFLVPEFWTWSVVP